MTKEVSNDIYTNIHIVFEQKIAKFKFCKKRYKFCRQFSQYSATRFITNYINMHDNQTCQW